MNRVAIDIETAPIEGAEKFFDPESVKLGNTKDPAKVQVKMAEARASFIEKAALHWSTGQVTCICLYGDAVNVSLVGLGEKQILTHFWEHFDRIDQLISYNGYDFDMQFVIMRSLANGIKCPATKARGKKYIRDIDTDRHVDLYNVFDCGLDVAARALLGEGKTGTGKQAIDLFKNNDYDELAKYCMKDAELTWKLWTLLGGK